MGNTHKLKDAQIDWLNNIGSATFVIDTSNKVVFWSHSCEILTGVKSEEVINTNNHWKGFYTEKRNCLADMVLEDNWEEKTSLFDHVTKAPNTKRGLMATNWCQTPAGKKYLIFEANALYDERQNIIGVIQTLSDATRLKQTENELQMLSKAVEYASSSVLITDPSGTIKFVNPRFTEITGYLEKEVIGEQIDLIRPHTSDSKNYKEIEQQLSTIGYWKGELHSVRKDGRHYWERCSLSLIKDANGKVTHIVGVQDDVTSEHEAAKKLNYDATHDTLTGLINRRGFEEKAEELIRSKNTSQTNHSLCFIDLDQFKIVNDTCGHEAGDELLRRISKIFIDNVRKNDTLARLGGDEFVILMENCDIEPSFRLATTLLNVVKSFDFAWQGESFKIGLSIGIVVFNETMTSLIELMRQADSACYLAKDMGRNRIQIYSDDDSNLNKRQSEIKWVTKIQRALEEDAFYLDAQAIETLGDENSIHYELLVRMRDDNGCNIPPNEFLPSAERYNLIALIDRWVIKKAMTLLVKNPVFLQQVNFVSINLSGQSMVNNELMSYIQDLLNETGISGSKLCFEITETSAIKNLTTAINLINGLKKQGCSFAIDDFGSGLSSYGYLKNLPVDYLKIDGVFIKEIVNDPIDYALVKSINEVGHILNIKTIAEFVENNEIKGMLKAIGVDYVQGYGISKPICFEDILDRANNVIEMKRSIAL